MPISLLRALLGLLLLLHVAHGAFTFRAAMVMDASNDVSLGRLKGHAAFLSVFAKKYPGGASLGREIEGVDRPRFNFSLEVNTGLSRNREREQLEELLKGEDRAHFLFGVESDQGLAALSGAFAERRRRIMMHCCAEDNAFQGRKWEFFFTMMPTYVEALRPVMDALFTDDVQRIGVVYDESSSYYRSACEALIEKLGQINASQVVFVHTKNSTLRYEDGIAEAVDGAINEEVTGFIGCTSRAGAESFINAFWERKYALKIQAYTQGPTESSFVQSLGERSKGVTGIALFHPAARYEDDNFFENPQSFLTMLGLGEDIDEGIALSAGSFYTLFWAIQDAFSDCDVAGANGDVDRLLFENGAIRCSDRKNSGYERVQQSLRFLEIKNSIIGPIEFDKINQNFRRGISLLMTQIQPLNDSQLVSQVVSPALFASSQPDLPVRNPFAPQVCLPGFFGSNDKFNPCKRCPRGSVSLKEDAPACSQCLQDTYSSRDRTECIPCPDNAFTNGEGSKSIRYCRCENGFYNKFRLANITDKDVGDLNCVACPMGAQCGGRDSLPVPLPGFWADPSFPAEIHKCEDETSCPGGFKCGAKDNGTPIYEGRLCSGCAPGFFSTMGQCMKCVSTVQVIFLLLLLYSAWFFVNNFVASEFDTFEMVLTWIQLANIVGSLDLDWPEKLTTLFSITSVLDFDVDAIEPSCIFPSWGFTSNFSVQLLLPAILSILAACRYGIFYFLYRRKLSFILSGKTAARSLSLEQIIHALGFRVPARRADEWLREKKDEAVAQSLSAVDLTYLTITRYCFEVAKCDTIAGISVLRSSPDVECSSSSYRTLKVLASCGFIIYTVGYIMFTSYTLIRLHYTRMYPNKRSILRFGYLYQRFELGFAWVAIASLLVRILFVAAVVFIDDPKASVGIMSLVGVGWLLIQVYTLPYVNATLDFLQTCLLVGLLIITFSGLMFSSASLGSHPRRTLESIELTAVCIMAAAACVITIREIIVKVKLKILRSRHRKAVIKSLPKDVDPSIIEHDVVVTGGVEEELYGCFDPDYLYQWLKSADEDMLLDFDKLSIMLSPYLSEDSYSSYLSQEIVARFWRKLVDGFPEVIDYLLLVDETSRVHFCQFTRVLYRGFFLRHHAKGARFHQLINWRDRAALAQWLALAKGEDREFFTKLVMGPFKDYFKDVPPIPVPSSDEHCIERYISNALKDTMLKSSDSTVREPWLSRFWKSMSVDWKAAMEELHSGRGPLAHEHKGESSVSRTDLCQFARELAQAKEKSCRRRCLKNAFQVC